MVVKTAIDESRNGQGNNQTHSIVRGETDSQIENLSQSFVHIGSIDDVKLEFVKLRAGDLEDIGNIVGMITMGRWVETQNGDVVMRDGIPVPGTAYYAQHDLRRLSQSETFVISDTTKDLEKHSAAEIREYSLKKLTQNSINCPLTFVMTPKTQDEVFQYVRDRIESTPAYADLRNNLDGQIDLVLRGMLTDTGYASQRYKLDEFLFSKYRATGENSVVFTTDDDMRFPDSVEMLVNSPVNLREATMPNSQVIMRDDLSKSGFIDRTVRMIMRRPYLKKTVKNSLAGFFEAGKSVGELQSKYPGFEAREDMADNMGVALEKAPQGMQSFTVSNKGTPISDPRAKVISVTGTKRNVPDFRTFHCLQNNIRLGLPKEETLFHTYQSGEQKPHAYRKSDTNVDSANISLEINEDTSNITRWFVSSLEISKRNKTNGGSGSVVASAYRADNEMLPTLFDKLVKLNSRYNFLYGSGFGTDCVHSRTQQGYRPGLLEATTASLVGHVAAAEAVKRISLNDRGEMVLDLDANPRVFNDDGSINQEFLRYDAILPESIEFVYGALEEVLQMCEDELERCKPEKKQAYRDLIDQTLIKMKGRDKERFIEDTRVEIAEQVRYFAKVLEAAPIVREILQEMITKGDGYPVEKYSR